MNKVDEIVFVYTGNFRQFEDYMLRYKNHNYQLDCSMGKIKIMNNKGHVIEFRYLDDPSRVYGMEKFRVIEHGTYSTRKDFEFVYSLLQRMNIKTESSSDVANIF